MRQLSLFMKAKLNGLFIDDEPPKSGYIIMLLFHSRKSSCATKKRKLSVSSIELWRR